MEDKTLDPKDIKKALENSKEALENSKEAASAEAAPTVKEVSRGLVSEAPAVDPVAQGAQNMNEYASAAERKAQFLGQQDRRFTMPNEPVVERGLVPYTPQAAPVEPAPDPFGGRAAAKLLNNAQKLGAKVSTSKMGKFLGKTALRGGVAFGAEALDNAIPHASNDTWYGQASNVARDLATDATTGYGFAGPRGAAVGGIYGVYDVARKALNGGYSANGLPLVPGIENNWWLGNHPDRMVGHNPNPAQPSNPSVTMADRIPVDQSSPALLPENVKQESDGSYTKSIYDDHGNYLGYGNSKQPYQKDSAPSEATDMAQQALNQQANVAKYANDLYASRQAAVQDDEARRWANYNARQAMEEARSPQLTGNPLHDVPVYENIANAVRQQAMANGVSQDDPDFAQKASQYIPKNTGLGSENFTNDMVARALRGDATESLVSRAVNQNNSGSNVARRQNESALAQNAKQVATSTAETKASTSEERADLAEKRLALTEKGLQSKEQQRTAAVRVPESILSQAQKHYDTLAAKIAEGIGDPTSPVFQAAIKRLKRANADFQNARVKSGAITAEEAEQATNDLNDELSLSLEQQSSGKIPEVKTKAEVDKLLPGSSFTMNGIKYTKPKS